MRREEMRLPCQCEQIHRQLVKRKAALPRTCPERPYPRAQALPLGLPVRVCSCVFVLSLSLSCVCLRRVHRKKGKNKLSEEGNKDGQKKKQQTRLPKGKISKSIILRVKQAAQCSMTKAQVNFFLSSFGSFPSPR
jgi:hypothetical protein